MASFRPNSWRSACHDLLCPRDSQDDGEERDSDGKEDQADADDEDDAGAENGEELSQGEEGEAEAEAAELDSDDDEDLAGGEAAQPPAGMTPGAYLTALVLPEKSGPESSGDGAEEQP